MSRAVFHLKITGAQKVPKIDFKFFQKERWKILAAAFTKKVNAFQRVYRLRLPFACTFTAGGDSGAGGVSCDAATAAAAKPTKKQPKSAEC